MEGCISILPDMRSFQKALLTGRTTPPLEKTMSYETRIDLAHQIRKESAALLQARLSDALDLEAQTKQAHWNVKGRNFLQLHELFDKIHGEVEEFVDLIAERITALGHVADGRIQK